MYVVRVDSLDAEGMSGPPSPGRRVDSTGAEGAGDTGAEGLDGADAMGGTVEFVVGAPRLSVTRGRVRLFRSRPAGAGAAVEDDAVSAVPTADEDACGLPALRSTTVLCLGVPIEMSPADFMEFIGEAAMRTVASMRFVAHPREEPPGNKDGGAPAAGPAATGVKRAGSEGTLAERLDTSYLVIMELRSQAHADALFVHSNGRAYMGFGSVTPAACQLVFAARVEDDCGSAPDSPGAAASDAALTEMPSCPVCLERLDRDISGVLTTVCNHSFHASCMREWWDSSCPVCRYCARGEVTRCSTCGASTNLWMCLVCGHVGCGRYGAAHALEHFRETGHTYSLEVETQRVWDYVGDNYVHRLIQAHGDGKLVEVPTPPRSSGGGGSGGGAGPSDGTAGGAAGGGSCGAGDGADADLQRVVYDSKVEGVIFEYTALLSSQLESQRQHYESLLAAATADSTLGDDARAALESARRVAEAAERDKRSFSRQLSEARARAERAEAEVGARFALSSARSPARARTRPSLALREAPPQLTRARRAHALRAARPEQTTFLRSLNEQHQSNAAAAQRRLDAATRAASAVQKQKDQRISELEEQVRDLMLYLDASVRAAASGSPARPLRAHLPTRVRAPLVDSWSRRAVSRCARLPAG